jgi:hypothetical protein
MGMGDGQAGEQVKRISTLQWYFEIANRRHFRNRLTNVTVKWDRGLPERTLGTTRSQLGPVPKGTRTFKILINHKLKGSTTVTLLTLLHEMVHVEQWDKIKKTESHHGHKFNRRMKDLAVRGAFRDLW